jgi:hypothetical protein
LIQITDRSVRQRTDAGPPLCNGAGQLAQPLAGKTFQECKMSKGNKESKKPKRVMPAAKAPGAGGATPTPVTGSKPLPRKKWPTT